MAAWQDLATLIEGDVAREVAVDAPTVIHKIANIATGGVTASIPGPGDTVGFLSIWLRYRVIIVGLLAIGAIWYFFFRGK